MLVVVREGLFKKKGLYSGKQREWDRIGVNSGGLLGGVHGS